MEEENPFAKPMDAQNLDSETTIYFFTPEQMLAAYKRLSPLQKNMMTLIIYSLEFSQKALFGDNKSNSSNHRTHRH